MILVEGESDCHVLWHFGFPALGLPGVQSWKDERDAPHIALLRTYLILEPGPAPLQLLSKLAAQSLASYLLSELLVVSLPEKDPAALYRAVGDAFPTAMVRAIAEARTAGKFLSSWMTPSPASHIAHSAELPTTGTIGVGERNGCTFEVARRLRGIGATLKATSRLAHLFNRTCCRPPLPGAEVDGIVASVWKKEKWWDPYTKFMKAHRVFWNAYDEAGGVVPAADLIAAAAAEGTSKPTLHRARRRIQQELIKLGFELTLRRKSARGGGRGDGNWVRETSAMTVPPSVMPASVIDVWSWMGSTCTPSGDTSITAIARDLPLPPPPPPPPSETGPFSPGRSPPEP